MPSVAVESESGLAPAYPRAADIFGCFDHCTGREKNRALLTRLLHGGVTWFQSLRRLVWFFTEPQTVGVHGVPLAPDGKVVLVMLSYARGWRLPGGGKRMTEDSRTAMIRELREEIGLTGFDSVDLVTNFERRPDRHHGEGYLFVVRGVRYRPKWSLEIKQVGAFALDDLPADTAVITRQLLALALPALQPIR